MLRNLLESGFVIKLGPVSLCYEEAVANQLPAIHLLRGIGEERETICKLCGWTLQKPLTGSYKTPILKADKRM